jgi:GT2 family glycosyltransferase
LSAAAEFSIVLVLHNSGDTVGDAVRSMPDEAEVVVIDNGSDDDGVDLVLRQRPDAVIVRQHNGGYGFGANAGARVASRRYLLFMNPDARLDVGSLDLLYDTLLDHPTSVVGPRLLDDSGATVYMLRRSAHPMYEFLESLPSEWNWVPAALRRDFPASDERYKSGGVVPSLVGACFALSASTYAEAGGLDEDFFLYGEEDTLAHRVRRLGGQCVYVPQATVRHTGETSTNKVRAFAMFHRYRSCVLLYRKQNRGALAALALLAGLSIRGLKARRGDRTLWRAACRGAVNGFRTPL